MRIVVGFADYVFNHFINIEQWEIYLALFRTPWSAFESVKQPLSPYSKSRKRLSIQNN